jgi:hypothetical protein
LVWPGQPLSPGVPKAQGLREAWFLDRRVPQAHFVFRDCEAVLGPFSRSSSRRRSAYRDDQGRVSPDCDGGVFHETHLLFDRLNHQFCRAAESSSDNEFFGPPLPKKSKKGEIRAFFSVGDFPIEANRSVVEGLCQSSKLAALMAALAPAMYTRLVEGRRFSRDCSKSLTTSLIGLACALTRSLSLSLSLSLGAPPE